MATMVDVARHYWGGMASESDELVGQRLAQEARQYEVHGAVPNNLFSLRLVIPAAYKDGDVETFAKALGVPWPVPERVTVQSLAADLAALHAKFQAFVGSSV